MLFDLSSRCKAAQKLAIEVDITRRRLNHCGSRAGSLLRKRIQFLEERISILVHDTDVSYDSVSCYIMF